MRSSPFRSPALLALCCAAVLATACKKKPAPTDTDTDVVMTDPVPDPVVELQVVSVSPANMPPQTQTPIRVYGAGFEVGVKAEIGGVSATQLLRDDANSLSMTAPALPVGSHDLLVVNPDGGRVTLRSAIRVVEQQDTSCNALIMYFDLDGTSLSTSARSALDAAVPCLRTKSMVRLEGHADERGTTDYNLALGQRRAESVQRYLTSQGLQQSKLPITSFGEERPSDSRSSEAAWAKNRRVEISAR